MTASLSNPTAEALAIPAAAPLPDDTTADHNPHTLIIEAGREESQYWRDLWRGRELLGFMVWRDIVVRYKQTVIGLAWSILRPFLTMVAGVFIFQAVLHVPGLPGVPYAILLYAAILPWQFFSDGLGSIGLSLLNNSNVITKIYFPRLMIPLSKLIVSLVDFLLSAVVLMLIMAWYRYLPSAHILFLPLFLLLACLTALGAGLWFAALNVKYRDFMYIIPFILQFGAYGSSVFFSTDRIYASTSLPNWVKFAYTLNPMVGVIDGFRWCLLGDQSQVHWTALACSCALVLLMLGWGHHYFRKTEKTFADVI
jgi:lipopolysaccharide transport system permease protein